MLLWKTGIMSIKAIIVDDPHFLGYIFHFYNISFDYESDGIGVSYDLNIDIHKDYLPTTISNEKTELVKKAAREILERLMTDLVDAHNSDALDNSAEMV